MEPKYKLTVRNSVCSFQNYYSDDRAELEAFRASEYAKGKSVSEVMETGYGTEANK